MEEQVGKTSEQPAGVNIRTITVGVECSPDNFVVQCKRIWMRLLKYGPSNISYSCCVTTCSN